MHRSPDDHSRDHTYDSHYGHEHDADHQHADHEHDADH